MYKRRVQKPPVFVLLWVSLLVAGCDQEGVEAQPGPDRPGAAAAEDKTQRKAGVVPTVESELRDYLQDKGYKNFVAGEKVGSAAGHGPAQTFFNPLLLESLKKGNTEHPVGSAAVKELLDENDALFGWTVSVKTQSGMGGKGWFWFEVQSTDPKAPAIASGNGKGQCVRCHISGIDLVHAMPPK